MLWPVRTYSTSTNKEQDQHYINKPNLNKDSINPLVYVNAYSMKKTNIFFGVFFSNNLIENYVEKKKKKNGKHR
jgi:hypothetical protein